MRSNTLSMICVPAAFLVLTALLHDRPQNPPMERERSIETALKVPPRVQDMLRRACYDCHSSETRWPWYARVPPMSGRIESDVARGRAVMNFSEWTMSAGASPARAAGTLSAACAAVQRGIMPKPPYPYLHPEARLSKIDIDSFCAWTREQAAELGAISPRRSVEVQP
jgi:Haem-binding domain